MTSHFRIQRLLLVANGRSDPQMRARLKAIVRERILRGIAYTYGLDTDDKVGMSGLPQYLADDIMQSLFGKWPPPEEE